MARMRRQEQQQFLAARRVQASAQPDSGHPSDTPTHAPPARVTSQDYGASGPWHDRHAGGRVLTGIHAHTQCLACVSDAWSRRVA
eukprot:SAG25_NODE_44_length_19254_cov_246.998121_28_plen_85_part_00